MCYRAQPASPRKATGKYTLAEGKSKPDEIDWCTHTRHVIFVKISEMAPSKYDIVIYGATGFTGSLAAAYVAKQYAGKRVKWAIAGRSASKLETIAKECGADCGIIIAEVTHLLTNLNFFLFLCVSHSHVDLLLAPG